MKKTLMVLATGMLALTGFSAAINLNGSWDFRFHEKKAIEEVDIGNGNFTDTMVVPGCFDMMPKWYLKRGTAVYSRSFVLDEDKKEGYLVIDGMGLRGKFMLDGKDLGLYALPYSRLEIPTGELKAGRHTLTAALDNRFDWKTTKLALSYYDFYFYGGFYHGVSLKFDNRKLFVRTSDLQRGEVEIEAVNFPEKDFEALVSFDGASPRKLRFTDSRVKATLQNASLWSPETPNLHTVKVAVDGLAPCSARFGLRTIVAKDKHIYLNGEKLFLKGVNRHESNMQYGTSTTEDLMLRDLQLIKATGANFIRGAHYPQSQRFLDLCDEVGILVWEESLGWGNDQDYTTGKNNSEVKDPEWQKLQIEQTRLMVRNSFNHPSVIIFGFLNECGSFKPHVKDIVDALIRTIKAEDSGRLVTFACNMIEGDLCCENVDLVSFNTYPGIIPAQPGAADEFHKKVSERFTQITKIFRERYPDKPIMCSETGTAALYGERDPGAAVLTEEFQIEYLSYVLDTIWNNPDLSGFSIWQFCDNRVNHRNGRAVDSGKRMGYSQAGIFNAERMPKLSVKTVTDYFTNRTPASIK